MSSRISRFSGYSLAALSAALSFHAGSATAGDPSSQAQSISVQQAVQDVLTGNHRFLAAPETRTAGVDTVKSAASVQESVQQVLLGPSRFHVGITEATGRAGGSREVASSPREARRPSPFDTQAAVQRMLRGDRG